MSFNLSKFDVIIITRHHPREVVEKLATGMGREDPIETDDEANQQLQAVQGRTSTFARPSVVPVT